jgi:hypothetical protein
MTSNIECELETRIHVYQNWFLSMALYSRQWNIKIVRLQTRQESLKFILKAKYVKTWNSNGFSLLMQK